MPATLRPPPAALTVADMLARLGVPPERVRLRPVPGTATERDLLDATRQGPGIFELVDGTLVAKAVGFESSLLAMYLGHLLIQFVSARKLGQVTGPDGLLRLCPGLLRGPDIAFVSWKRLPRGRMPKGFPSLAPDLAVEVLSPSNTAAEMKRKREEYIRNGVRLVWIVDPDSRTVEVFAPRRKPVVLTKADTLDGGKVLPGFSLALAELFAELDEERPS